MAARTASRPKPAANRRWPRRLTGWAIKAILGFVILSVLWVLILRFVPPPITLTMLGDVPTGHGVTKSWRPLSKIDPDMPRAVIAAEDSRFCAHNGFDYIAIANAARRNAEGGRIRGGSTISQQTAKNVFLWQGGGYFRKGLEAYFTVLIEAMWGKRRIMEVYLNVAETGIGTYGVEAARVATSSTAPTSWARARPPRSPPSCHCPRSAPASPRPASPAATPARSNAASPSSAARGWTAVSSSCPRPKRHPGESRDPWLRNVSGSIEPARIHGFRPSPE